MRLSFQFEVLKEPRGFIKVIQVFIAIFAFATCTGYRGEIGISQTCKNSNHKSLATFKYTFKQPIKFKLMVCNTTSGAPLKGAYVDHQEPMDYKTSMEYYVVIGVFCFLYSLGMLVYYIAFEPETPSATPSKISPPVLDFVISAFLVLFWFTGAIACASAVTGIKGVTDVAKMIGRIADCQGKSVSCSPSPEGNYATLDISALLGFLNVFVWAGNMWFLFKETPWHSPRGKAPATVSGPGRDQPAQVTPPAAAI